MPPKPSQHIQTRSGEKIRIGPLSLITLIIVICMAVMGVLSISTSYATQTISARQASATQQLYLNERAGQEFIASLDDALVEVRDAGGSTAEGARTVEQRLDAICESARAAADGRVSCTANVNGAVVTAEFVCEGARALSIAITIQNDATYRVTQWKMTSAQQEAQTGGVLWTGE